MPRQQNKLANKVIDRLAALAIRAPSAPVRVNDRPWDGSPIADLAFVMMLNDNIVMQQRRVARACLASDLRVAFINVAVGQEWAPRRSDYADLGVPIVDISLGLWRKGAMDFPSPFTLLGKVPKLKAVFPRSPFTVLVAPLDTWGECQLLCYWAKSAGVVSVVLQEGMTLALDAKHPYGANSEARPCYRAMGSWLVRQIPHDLFKWWIPYSYADFFCAYGQAASDELARYRDGKDTTFVVGNPGLDHITGLPSLAPVREGRRTVLYVQQQIVGHAANEDFCNELARICCDENDDRLLIKLHPRSDLTVHDLSRQVTQTNKRALLLEIVKHGDSSEMLGGVDVLVTVNSTTAYYALVEGIPVITVDYLARGSGEFDASRYGGAIAVHDPGDLRRAIFNATRNEDVRRQLHEGARQVIERHLYRLDGRASERIAQVLLELARGQDPALSSEPLPGG